MDKVKINFISFLVGLLVGIISVVVFRPEPEIKVVETKIVEREIVPVAATTADSLCMAQRSAINAGIDVVNSVRDKLDARREAKKQAAAGVKNK
jgi:uncharacterized NAD-dependent epimerase/dehydratase family protein